MVLKANLAACGVFVLGTVGICLLDSTWTGTMIRPSDVAILLFFVSPALLWAGGALAFRGRGGWSIAWLSASIFFMGAELFTLYHEAVKAHQEAITGQPTQSLLGFLVILGQWAVGLPHLVVLALVCRITQVVESQR
jgi:hypothetical protein